MEHVSNSCYAAINGKNRVCDANSGLINVAGGVVIDTQSDLPHAREMIRLFSDVWKGMPEQVINTHEDADHVYGNQLFSTSEIIGHRCLPERMASVAEPKELQDLMRLANGKFTGPLVKMIHPGVVAAGRQLYEDYNFDGVELVPPTTLFDDRLVLQLDDMEVHLIHVGPCHQAGDTLVWVPKEKVLFAGDVIFRMCTPMGWVGTFKKWCEVLDYIIDELRPEIIVPGHGPVCGIEGATDMKGYLCYVRDESKASFDAGTTAVKAAGKLDLGPYADWESPERLYMNVERAYREFRGEPADQPWNQMKTFDEIYRLAKNRGLVPVF